MSILVVFKPHNDADMPDYVLEQWPDAPYAPSIGDGVVLGGQGTSYTVKHRYYYPPGTAGVDGLVFCMVVPDEKLATLNDRISCHETARSTP